MGECITLLLHGLHCRQGRAQSTPQAHVARSRCWGKALIPPLHHLVGYLLCSALETIRSHPKIAGSSSCPGCAAHGCCFAGGFPLRPLELALPWGQWAGRERPGLKAFISPVWINLACLWPCPDHWAARAASGTKPGGRLEAKWPRARCSQAG